MTDFLDCDLSRLTSDEGFTLTALILKAQGYDVQLLWDLFCDELRAIPKPAPGEKADLTGLSKRALARYRKAAALLGRDKHEASQR